MMSPQSQQPPGPMALQPTDPTKRMMIPPAQRLPDAHRMYQYGPRQIYWTDRVPVAEPNTGVMVNAEFLAPPGYDMGSNARELVKWDLGIRNQYWQHQGPWLQPYDPVLDATAAQKAKMFGDYEQARDLVAPCRPGAYRRHYGKQERDSWLYSNYKQLAEERDRPGLFKESKYKKQEAEWEFFDDNDLQELFTNPEGAMHN